MAKMVRDAINSFNEVCTKIDHEPLYQTNHILFCIGDSMNDQQGQQSQEVVQHYFPQSSDGQQRGQRQRIVFKEGLNH